MEFRSFMGAHIKRNDPAMRRLIQYLRMDTSKFRIVVRDAKTGKIIVAPPEEVYKTLPRTPSFHLEQLVE